MVAVVPSLILLSLVLTACGGDGDRREEEVSDFIAVAEDASCADDVNRLYRIDGERVLWQREDLGCADAAYAISLYGRSPDDELCSSFQTIGGPVTECSQVTAQADFATIIDHLDEPDLGLGREHTVELVWDASDEHVRRSTS
jgi:hypothetical protein